MRRVPSAVLTTAVASLALVASLAAAGPSGAADGAGSATTGDPAAGSSAPATPTADGTDTSDASGASATGASTAARAGKKNKTPDKFTPKNGVKFNNPVGTANKKRVLLRQLIRTINSVPKGEEIRIASWNIRSNDVADALIAAYNRGVSVQAVMDNLNANPKVGNNNVPVNRLVGAFARSRKKSDPLRRSSVIKCISSCRSSSGIAHTKFFLFSKAGKANDVVMYGSNNATDLAAYFQWNDLYTVTESPTLYAEFEAVFYQMRKDKFYRQPYLTYDHPELVPPLTTYFYPYVGEGAVGDPLLDDLSKIQCTGATNGTGTDGRTRIRIAQTSMHSKRGLQIATRLRQLWEQGCDIKVVYAVFGNNVLKILRHTTRGAVPIKQIAQDFNLDGVYDRYLHLKDMAVSGVYDGNTAAQVTWNGSANWTSVALASDEIVGKVVDPKTEAKYADWVDYLYKNPPRYRGRTQTLATVARMSALARGVSPDTGIEEN